MLSITNTRCPWRTYLIPKFLTLSSSASSRKGTLSSLLHYSLLNTTALGHRYQWGSTPFSKSMPHQFSRREQHRNRKKNRPKERSEPYKVVTRRLMVRHHLCFPLFVHFVTGTTWSQIRGTEEPIVTDLVRRIDAINTFKKEERLKMVEDPNYWKTRPLTSR